MTGSVIGFRPLARRDFALLSQWLSAPHVRTWWREDPGTEAVEERYGPVVDGRDPTEVFVVERGGQPIGLIQRYRIADNPDWQASISVAGSFGDAAGIDYFIGREDLIGAGIGPQVIGRFVGETWDHYPEVTAVVASIQVDNRRSWRALEKIGFRRAWTGTLVSDDPSDAGTSHVYVADRPVP